jgi:hypothetical protein
MLPCVCARLLVTASLISSTAAAHELSALLPLPKMAICDRVSQPNLPERWRATYLMAPFTNGQLVLADILYDASLPAMRVRLFGVKSGSADLLVLKSKTYVVGNGPTAKDCRDLGDTGWRPIPRNWLTPQSQCTGSAPIGETPVDWWRTPIQPTPASYWVWFKTSDRSPFRLVFPFASDRLPPFSRYALSYQVSFEPLVQTDLSATASMCKGTKLTTPRNGRRALRELVNAMSRSPDRAKGEIERLMPALAPSCDTDPFPRWPEHLAITGVMTPFDSDEDPYPTEVLYDWTVPGQRTRTFGRPESKIAAQDSLLLGPHGYNVTYHRPERLTCEPVLPGTIRPDWASRAPCECAAQITGTMPLTPYGTTQILVCPLASPRVAWAWYARAGRPKVFMVTSRPGDEGKGLFAVLDYHDWRPGHRVPRSVFDRPAQCMPRANSRGARAPALNKCSTCHLGKASSRE